MKPRLLMSLCAAASLLAGASLASAQTKDVSSGSETPAQQAAPAESSHAAGHDAQSGKPETAKDSTGSSDQQKNEAAGKPSPAPQPPPPTNK